METQYPLLSEIGYEIGDLIVLAKHSTDFIGGIVYKIVFAQEPIEIKKIPKTKTVKNKKWISKPNPNYVPNIQSTPYCNNKQYVDVFVEDGTTKEVIYTSKEYYDASGNRQLYVSKFGYVRIQPYFEFYPSTLPIGKDTTHIICYDTLKNGYFKKVTVSEIGMKLFQLQSLLKEIVSL